MSTLRLKYRQLISFDKVRAAFVTAVSILLLGAATGAAEAASDIDLTPELGPLGDPVEQLIVLGIGGLVATLASFSKKEHNAYGAGPPPRPPEPGSAEANATWPE